MDIKLKASYKAALLSLFILPGIGQLYLRRYWRGLVIMAIFLTGLGYMIWIVTISALTHLDEAMVMIEGGTKNPRGLPDIVGSKMVTERPYQDLVSYIILFIWIFSVIDAYRIGRQREL
jgi:TM2 domain-containing membrane protein YozV